MDEEFQATVLEELDKARRQTRCERRKYERIEHWCLRVVLILKEAGEGMAFVVATRNVSRGGVSLLHRQMMYAREPCTLFFPLQGGKHLLVPGHTVRCRHVRGVLHEIGVRFDRPLSAEELDAVLKEGRASVKPYMKRAHTQARASS